MTLSWFCARTNPRCEGRAVASLSDKGFAAYSPRIYSVRLHHRTKAEIERFSPLMVGYVFVGMEEAARHFGFARRCDGVKAFLGVNGKPMPISAKAIEPLFDAEFRGEFNDIAANVLQRRRDSRQVKGERLSLSGGELVQVASGIFATKNGVVAKIMNRNKALVRLEECVGVMEEVTVDVDALRLVA
ncbi:transcription termination/antitermination protein NusG [Aureimonas pseudogalii]|uniref:Transcription antitermination factor NusG n=1 Tax=Aureimonas pseudogalii TaxID=1744844 RepID=A0A7W6EEK9_9HYPH|nr:transcription termination/antitermination NusG family protein [Aureimonas pseudogalii]MBB3997215.1 transcription antitermination factor NusG [Aureimonas pseudogalii]